MLQSVRSVFRALAVTIVPEASGLGPDGWTELEQLVERAIEKRPPTLRRQLRAFLSLLQWLPLLRYCRPFTSLDPARRTRFLPRIQDSRLLLLRRGFWGLRTLILLGYYGRPAAAGAIGYRADPRGWEARRERA